MFLEGTESGAWLPFTKLIGSGLIETVRYIFNTVCLFAEHAKPTPLFWLNFVEDLGKEEPLKFWYRSSKRYRTSFSNTIHT